MLISFAGSSVHRLDKKNRISIPAKYRRWNNDEENCTFVVAKAQGSPSLDVKPAFIWDNFAKKLRENYNELNIKHAAYIRNFFKDTERINCDRHGRILLPQNLIDYADLKEEVLIIGIFDKLELWDQKIYDSFVPNTKPIDDEYFDGLADRHQ